MSQAMQDFRAMLSCVRFNGEQHTHIQITETDHSAILKKVNLMVPNGDWFSVEIDNGRKCVSNKTSKGKCNAVVMSPLLSIGSNFKHHCGCDSVVVQHKEGKLDILYIDLKSGNPTGYANQFKSSRQFMRYAVNLLEEFFGHQLDIDKERFLVFHSGKINIAKQTTSFAKRVSANQYNQGRQPDDARKEIVEIPQKRTLYLNQFI